jgi:hypothetical protein
MKLRQEEMRPFPLDYGELIRPVFKIVPDSGWAQGTNETDDILIVYGPKHPDETSIFDTTPYVLPPGATTPDRWDCKGFYVPADRRLFCWRRFNAGPLAVKFWNYRRFRVRAQDTYTYAGSWHNGAFQPSQINWAIPNLTYHDIRERIRGAEGG